MAMTRSPITRLLHETVRLLLGLVALAALTGLCFWLDFGLVSTAFTYLILIVVLSLAVAFIPLVVLSFIAVGCLNFFSLLRSSVFVSIIQQTSSLSPRF
jgi:hypothetical protein